MKWISLFNNSKLWMVISVKMNKIKEKKKQMTKRMKKKTKMMADQK